MYFHGMQVRGSSSPSAENSVPGYRALEDPGEEDSREGGVNPEGNKLQYVPFVSIFAMRIIFTYLVCYLDGMSGSIREAEM